MEQTKRETGEQIKHTPGPWAIWADEGSYTSICSVYGAGVDIRHILCVASVKRVTEEQANACLISAAPDLLKAAKAKLADCGDCKDAALMPGEVCSDECAALVAAIAKAEGTK